jgi:hypothetical protein
VPAWLGVMISSFASYGVKAKICLRRASIKRSDPLLLVYSGFLIDAIVTGTGRRRFFTPPCRPHHNGLYLVTMPLLVFHIKGSYHDIATYRRSNCRLYL